MNILFIGDIVGRPGRSAVREILPNLIKENQIDFVIANGENLASGSGLTLSTYEEMIKIGIDYFTSGNHVWSKKDFIKYLDEEDIKVIRPANYPDSVPGKGYCEIKINDKKIIIINLLGRVFLSSEVDNPFKVVNKVIDSLPKNESQIIIVDFHAEATSEKVCLGQYLDGRVAAVIGTHTHIPTADARILPHGTAYLTDAGMVGALNSSIGVELKPVLNHFLTGMPVTFDIPKQGEKIFSAALLKINDKTNKVINIELIKKIIR